MILMTISLMASAAVVQPPAASAPAPDAAAATTVEGKLVDTRTAYEQMVHAAAEVAQHGELPPDDSVDHAHRMAGSDRNKERYFNRPGATEAEYQQEWTGCRQIARRLASPNLNPALLSTAIAQGGLVGGMVGGLLVSGFDSAFSQLRARRDFRRQCLIARGWRMVEPDEAGQARIAALSREDREAYFNRMLGATEVEPGARVTDSASPQANGAAKHSADSAGQ